MTPLSYHSLNLSLIAMETMRSLVQVVNQDEDRHTSVVVITAHVYFVDLDQTSFRYVFKMAEA